MTQPIITVENLSKAYRIGLKEQIPDTLVGAATSWLKAPLRNWRRLRRLNTFTEPKRNAKGQQLSTDNCQLSTDPTDSDILWALKGVSFEVQEGEVLGIIGRNGAGKSTLLKILSRITDPTGGRAVIRGRVSSLLEVGTGFHPELSGRENIYMNGTILGMTKREIDRKFDEIVEFSGVERFLDTPIKRYSSGMTVRLAFSVAAHLEPEILIIDEVLAVGDAEFQKKCLGKMRDVSSRGRTVLFVSHNMDAILALCSGTVLMEGGRVALKASTDDAVAAYLGAGRAENCSDLSARERSYSSVARPIISDLRIGAENGAATSISCGSTVQFDVVLKNLCEYDNVVCSIVLVNDRAQRVAMFHSLYHSQLAMSGADAVSLRCVVPCLPLTPGTYRVQIGVGSRDMELLEMIDDAGYLNVLFSDYLGTGRIPNYRQGHIVLPACWEVHTPETRPY